MRDQYLKGQNEELGGMGELRRGGSWPGTLSKESCI